MITMDKAIIYKHQLNLDNEKGKTCNVIVKFNVNEDSSFGGFISEDLAHLEEWVVGDKEKWII